MSDQPALHLRSFEVELETGDGREILGRCVPYGIAADVADVPGEPYREQFERGAFAGAVKAPNRVALNYRHSEALGDQVGLASGFEEREDGLYGTFRAFAGALGDLALSMIREGALRGLSIGFTVPGSGPGSDRGKVVRTRCHLAHVGLVPAHEASYSEAAVLAVRSRDLERFRPRRDAELDQRLRSLGLIG